MKRLPFTLSLLFSLLLASFASLAITKPVIVIHGGAGTITKANLSAEKEQQIRAVLTQAVQAGYAQLQAGKPGVDAVLSSIQILEESPLFNAGRGAVYTYQQTHELDASIMNGQSLNAGAVAGVGKIKSPIAAARLVMEKSPHVMLSGQGAEAFARQHGLPMVSNAYFNSEFRLKALERVKRSMQQDKQALLSAEMADYKFGTVGAVVLDKQGNLAAGTSTGGMTAKRFGRIGDSPIIGAGTYANNASCAVSGTGHGEYFIRYQVASDICARLQYQGLSLAEAADQVVMQELVKAGGSGGVIAVDAKGNIAMPFNTQGMYRAAIDAKGKLTVAIYR